MFIVIDAKTVGFRIMEGFYKSFNRPGGLEFMQIFFLLGLLAYLCARMHLVVERFNALFHSPVEIYLPKWSAFVPHVSLPDNRMLRVWALTRSPI